MNNSFKYLNCGLMSITGFVIGVLLAINPERFISHSLLLLGAALSICGISGIAFYFKSNKTNIFFPICGISELVAGILMFVLKGFFVAHFAKLKALFAFIFIVIGAIYAFKLVSNIRKNGRIFTPSACVVLCLTSALIILLYPFAQWFLWRFIALTVALQGVMYIYVTFGSRAFDVNNKRKNNRA